MKRKDGAVIPRWDGRPFRIFAADPGGTTGVATAEWEPTYGNPSLETIKFRQWQIADNPHHLQLWLILSGQEYTEIIWESFDFRQNVRFDKDGNAIPERTKVELISREYIGILELHCELHSIPHSSRNASSIKHFITNEKISQLGLWLPGMPHAMDATRVLLRHMVVVKKIQSPFVDIWLADD